MTRKRLALSSVVLLAISLAAIAFYKPIAIHYLLWRYRVDPDLVEVYQPRLCRLGPDGRDPLIRAFQAIEPDQHVNHFRVTALHTLRCLRYDEAATAIGSPAIQDVVFADIPVDREAVDTMIAVFDQEPSAELREEMFSFTSELDFRTRFAFHVGLLQSSHPIPETYAAPPVVHPFPTDEAGRDVSIIRNLWCEQVAPLEVDRMMGRGAHPQAVTWYDRTAILQGLLDNDCEVSAPAVAEYVAFTDAMTRAIELEKLLEGLPPLQAYLEAQELQLQRETASLEQGRSQLSSDILLHDTLGAVAAEPDRLARYIGPILRQKHSCTLARDLRQALREVEIDDDHPLAEAVEVWGVQAVARCGEDFLWSGM